jgi:hypothetical protein
MRNYPSNSLLFVPIQRRNALVRSLTLLLVPMFLLAMKAHNPEETIRPVTESAVMIRAEDRDSCPKPAQPTPDVRNHMDGTAGNHRQLFFQGAGAPSSIERGGASAETVYYLRSLLNLASKREIRQLVFKARLLVGSFIHKYLPLSPFFAVA